MTEKPKTMSLSELCAALGIHRNTAYRLINDGKLVPLPSLKIQRNRYRFDSEYVQGLASQPAATSK